MLKAIVIVLLCLKGLQCDVCHTFRDRIEQLQNQYETLYNSSFEINQETSHRLDECHQQLDSSLNENQQLTENLKDVQLKLANYSEDSINHQIQSLLKKNIELESSLLQLNRSSTIRIKTSYLLINEYRQNITDLKDKLSTAISNAHVIDNDFNLCVKNLESGAKELLRQNAVIKNITSSLAHCIQREEDNENQKNGCFISLGNCRKRNTRLKIRVQQKTPSKPQISG